MGHSYCAVLLRSNLFGYRKMVKSPEPTGIMEIDSITYLMSNGDLPLAVGGGGVPVEKLDTGYVWQNKGFISSVLTITTYNVPFAALTSRGDSETLLPAQCPDI